MPDRSRLTIILACTLLAVTTAPAQAQSNQRRARKTSQASGTRVVQPKVRYANGDTEEQRRRREEARLRRECQGRPNAGACLGRTR